MKLFFNIIFIIVLIHSATLVFKIIPYYKRAKEIKNLKKSNNVISVDAEIVEITARRLNELDIQYDLKLQYEVGWEKFFKEIILINKQTVRLGQKLLLVCDADDPRKAYLSDSNMLAESGTEQSNMRGHIINLIAETVFIVLYITFILFYYCLKFRI